MSQSDEIRDAAARTLLDQLQNGTTVATKEGEAVQVSPTPALITAANGFLKMFPPTQEMDEVEAMHLSKTLKGYAEKMPFNRKVQ